MTIPELIDAYVLASRIYVQADVVRAPEVIMGKLDDARIQHRDQLVERLAVIGRFVCMGAVPEQLAEAWNGEAS